MNTLTSGEYDNSTTRDIDDIAIVRGRKRGKGRLRVCFDVVRFCYVIIQGIDLQRFSESRASDIERETHLRLTIGRGKEESLVFELSFGLFDTHSPDTLCAVVQIQPPAIDRQH